MDIILIGGFSEIIELCEDNNYNILGVIDPTSEKKILGYNVLGTDDDAENLFKEYANIPLIVSPDLPEVRRKLVQYYARIGFSFYSLISKKAIISKYATIGSGVIIHNGVNVSAMVDIGNYARLNVYSNIMHNCAIGAFSTVAPNGVLLGHVVIEENVYVGSNATVLPNITIGKNAIIGAGAVVTRNVSAAVTVKGVPAK